MYHAGPPVCPNDSRRIQTFAAYGLDFDMAPCTELDVLLTAVCRVFGAPYASIALYYNKTCWLCNTVSIVQDMVIILLSGSWSARQTTVCVTSTCA